MRSSVWLVVLFALFCAAFPLRASAEAGRPWKGRINGYEAYIPDLDKPVRAALVNNGSKWLPDDDPDWRAAAVRFNCLEIDVPVDYRQPDVGAQRILAALSAASALIPDHPEIEFAPMVLFGFSAGSAGVARAAASPYLSNPDPSRPPQRVLAVVALDELDAPPYLPPLSTPHLFLSDPGDFHSGLTTNVEDFTPATTHDAFARRRATEEGAPFTLISQPGHYHGGSRFGMHNRIDYKFASLWVEELLNLRLPSAPSKDHAAVLVDWRHRPGWVGTYDVVVNSGTEPWGNLDRMTDVEVFPSGSYKGPRPYIWLPSQYCAEVWRAYASTGSMPPLQPLQPLAIVEAFVRIPGGKPTGANDAPLQIFAGAEPGPGADAKRCLFDPDAEAIVSFDRAVTSGEAQIEGAAMLFTAEPPIFWSNRMRIKLGAAAGAGLRRIRLVHVAAQDGGPPLDAVLTPSCP